MNKKVIAKIFSVLLTTSMVLTGCSSGNTKSVSEDKVLKTLIYAQPTEATGLDPIFVSDTQSSRPISNIYEGLVRFKSGTTQVEPCLATSWKISDDSKVYTFTLRKNVKFQDGTAFNADAVKINFERQMGTNKKADMAYATMIFGNVKEVTKVDDYTVNVVLKNVFTPFLSNLALALGPTIVSPKALEQYGKLTENPVGTGPFKFVKWDKGQSITLEKYSDYWGNKANVDKLVFKFIKESSVRANELLNGSVDIAESIEPSDVKKLEDSKIQVLKQTTVTTTYAGFNTARAPFNNVKLREAVYHAINSADILQYTYQGYGEVAKTALPTIVPGYDNTVKPYEFNVAKSKAILKETGNENLPVKIITNTTRQKLGESVQNFLAKAGFNATLQVYTAKEYKQKVIQGEGDIFIYGWVGVNGDADIFLNLLNSKEIESNLNLSKYSNPKVDTLLAKGKSLPNGEERNSVYKEIQQILAVDVPWVNLINPSDITGTTSKVKNFKLQPTGLMLINDTDKN